MLGSCWRATSAALIPFLFLMGCVQLPIAGFLGGSSAAPSLPLLGGAIVAAGPAGFCVDSRNSQPAAGFAILVACDGLGNFDAELPSRHALITLQIERLEPESIAPTKEEIEGLTLEEEELGSNEVLLVEALSEPTGQLIIYRVAEPVSSTLQPLEARILTVISGRLSVLTLRGLSAAPMSIEGIEELARRSLTVLLETNENVGAGPS